MADPDRQDGGWARESEEFYRSGNAEVDDLVEKTRSLGLSSEWERGLDFGCGLGRVTQALSRRCGHVVGVDISSTMIAEASRIHSRLDNVTFRCITGTGEIADTQYDLVWSVLVLQHLGNSEAIADTLRTLAGRVAPAGVILVEIPHRAPRVGWRGHLRVRTRLFETLRVLGVAPLTLRRRLRLSPAMTMHALPETEVRAVLTRAGLTVLTVGQHGGPDGGDYRRYLAVRETKIGAHDVKGPTPRHSSA